jgi:arylsulfatase A-like enzyme
MEMVDNVVVVILDSLRADKLGVLGSDRGLTPNIDSLAKSSITFKNAYTCVNTTDPSVTSIHTGLYPRSTVYHHGELVTDTEKKRVGASDRLPEILSENDIATYATGYTLGRWNREGFDEYAGTREKREDILLDIEEKLRSTDPRLYKIAAYFYQKFTRLEETLRSPTENNGVTSLLKAVNSRSDPFYGLVHLMDTHMMYEADNALIADCLERFDYPNQSLKHFFAEHSESEFISTFVKERVTERDYEIGLARLLARYDASIMEVDQKIATLVSGLKEQGKWDDTALFVMADHGESLTEHGIYFDHHGLYDQTTHIPLVARIPEIDGQKCAEFVQPIDLFPTILSLFKISTERKYDGKNLLRLSESDRSGEWRDAVFIEEAYTQRRTAVRTDEWKYIIHRPDQTLEKKWGSSLECGYCKTVHGAEEELYELETDLREQKNCINDYPSVADDLRERVEQFERNIEYPDVDSAEGRPKFDDEDEVMQRLEDLGYQ